MLYQEKLQAEEDPNEKRFSCFIYSGIHQKFPNHCHTHLEIIYIVRNQVIISLNGKSQVCHKGDLVFVPMLIPHSIFYINEDPSSLMIFQLSLNFLDDGCTNLTERKMIHRGEKLQEQVAYSIDPDGIIGETFFKLQKLCEAHPQSGVFSNLQHNYGNDEIIEMWGLKGMVFLLFSALMQEKIIEFSKSLDDSQDICELSQIQPVLKLMTNHPEQKLSMEDAAQMSCMGYYNFCRTFKRIVGHSFIEHQNSLRVHRTEELLYETDKSITEIAGMVHFGTLSYFNRIFKKYNGISPSDYRKQRIRKIR